MAIGAPTRGPEAAGGDAADLSARGVDDFRAFARRRAAVRPEADPLARRALGERRLDARRAGKAALEAPPLLDRPGEPGLDRIDRLVELVAVEAQARFEPQRIARAEADRRDFGIGEQPPREGLRLVGGQRDLETVLAGVAGARDESGESAEAKPAAPT